MGIFSVYRYHKNIIHKKGLKLQIKAICYISTFLCFFDTIMGESVRLEEVEQDSGIYFDRKRLI